MVQTTIKGGHDSLVDGLAIILAGGTPNIRFIIESQKGHWVVIHEA